MQSSSIVLNDRMEDFNHTSENVLVRSNSFTQKSSDSIFSFDLLLIPLVLGGLNDHKIYKSNTKSI